MKLDELWKIIKNENKEEEYEGKEIWVTLVSLNKNKSKLIHNLEPTKVKLNLNASSLRFLQLELVLANDENRTISLCDGNGEYVDVFNTYEEAKFCYIEQLEKFSSEVKNKINKYEELIMNFEKFKDREIKKKKF